MFSVNTPFISLFVGAIVVVVLFLAAAVYSAYKRQVIPELKEVLYSMIRHPLLWTHVAIAYGAFQLGQYEVVFGTCITYLGLKFAASEFLTLKGGDYKYYFFGANWLNTWASAVISTKTLFALGTVAVLWIAGYLGKFQASIVSERILEIVIVWGGANALPWLSALKGKDMSWLNPVAKKTKTPAQNSPVALPEPQGVASPNIPVSTTAMPIESDKIKILLDSRPEYKALVIPDSIEGLNSFMKANICFYYQNAIDFIFGWRKLYEDKFNSVFGFDFDETDQHFKDPNFVKCVHGVTDIDTFLMQLEAVPRETYREMETVKSMFDRFIGNVKQLGDGWFEIRLARGSTRYVDLFVWASPAVFPINTSP